MTYDLSGVDVFFLVKELKALEGAKVDKIMQVDRKLFTIRFFHSKKKTVLRLLVPEIINITEQKYESPLTPLGFCSFLRKYLQNTRLINVSQKEFERIIIFEFESLKYGNLFLIIELFKPGNMILCKKEESEEASKEESKLIILNVLERQEFKSRKVAAREEYVFPPQQNNPVTLKIEDIMKLSENIESALGKTIATSLSLGGVYAEEIIVRSGLDKNAKELSKGDAKLLQSALKDFFGEKTDCGELEGKIFPVAMKSIKTQRKFESFNAGLDSIAIETKIEAGSSKKQKKKKSKTEALLHIQEKRIRELEREIVENQAVGEFIYEHYQEFAKLLDSIKELRAKNTDYEKIEQILSKNKHFKKLDKAKKTIILSWQEKEQK